MSLVTGTELLLNAVLTGALYGVIALGLSLTFGIMKVVNFAHGAFLMASMYMVYWLWRILGWHPYLSGLIVAPALFLTGYLLQGLVIEPVFRKEHADVREPVGVMLVTFGVGLVLANTALLLFGTAYRAIESPYAMKVIQIGEVLISVPRLVAFLGSIVITSLLYVFLNRTMIGKAMRATSQDREAARLMGVDDYRIYRLSFGLNLVILAAAGALLMPYFFVFPELGDLFHLKSFIIVVLGGVGNVAGALLGGLVIALIETFGTHLATAQAAEIMLFAAFVLTLLIRPKGLVGKE